jgi:hypothetical protein
LPLLKLVCVKAQLVIQAQAVRPCYPGGLLGQ